MRRLRPALAKGAVVPRCSFGARRTLGAGLDVAPPPFGAMASVAGGASSVGAVHTEVEHDGEGDENVREASRYRKGDDDADEEYGSKEVRSGTVRSVSVVHRSSGSRAAIDTVRERLVARTMRTKTVALKAKAAARTGVSARLAVVPWPVYVAARYRPRRPPVIVAAARKSQRLRVRRFMACLSAVYAASATS